MTRNYIGSRTGGRREYHTRVCRLAIVNPERSLHHIQDLIPTAKNYDIFAHCRWVRVAMLSGAAMNAFQALQQASTMSS